MTVVHSHRCWSAAQSNKSTRHAAIAATVLSICDPKPIRRNGVVAKDVVEASKLRAITDRVGRFERSDTTDLLVIEGHDNIVTLMNFFFVRVEARGKV